MIIFHHMIILTMTSAIISHIKTLPVKYVCRISKVGASTTHPGWLPVTSDGHHSPQILTNHLGRSLLTVGGTKAPVVGRLSDIAAIEGRQTGLRSCAQCLLAHRVD